MMGGEPIYGHLHFWEGQVDRQRKRVLIVDDSSTAVLMTSTLLARGNYELVTATDGESGIQKALSCRPDAVILDWMMPGLSGIDVCLRLRAEQATRSVPIILLTTRGDLHSIEAGYAAGCTDYVTKPVNGAELLAKLGVLLAR